mmetsp:Transcript_18630/g.44100  ORF Transcript_18630/g.44100 Transcript_18630/m.44100 type:complete len:219 (-) Transcript_18630:303-959(-)
MDILRHQLQVGHGDVLVMIHHFDWAAPSAQVAAVSLMTERPLVVPIVETTITIILGLLRLHDHVFHHFLNLIRFPDVDFLRYPVNPRHVVDLLYGVDCRLRRGFIIIHLAADVYLDAAVGLFRLIPRGLPGLHVQGAVVRSIHERDGMFLVVKERTHDQEDGNEKDHADDRDAARPAPISAVRHCLALFIGTQARPNVVHFGHRVIGAVSFSHILPLM